VKKKGDREVKIERECDNNGSVIFRLKQVCQYQFV